MSNLGTCALCCENRELKESHIVPAFVWRWMKETSVTGFLRHGEAPNLRKQDGYKLFLLCSDCEQRFGLWENQFSRNVFIPFNKRSKLNSYGPWLLKFSTSISWRVLTFFKRELDSDHCNSNIQLEADEALETWKQFLLDDRPHPDKFQQHMLPVGLISNNNDPKMPENINRYIQRSVDIDLACSKKEAFIYVKMGSIFLIGFINMLHPNQWRDTKIHIKRGSLQKKHLTIPQALSNFIYLKSRRAKKSQEKISDRQWERIGSDYSKKMDAFAESEMFKAINQDSILFGEAAIEDLG
ncbi:MAG: hypothetical protein GY697_28230 [Desulfobacterales bacterium]|nr:hypothetical protein [Desulfobacterales bacterium]